MCGTELAYGTWLVRGTEVSCGAWQWEGGEEERERGGGEAAAAAAAEEAAALLRLPRCIAYCHTLCLLLSYTMPPT
eukprot:62336-Rhodomonas_salina.1